MYTFFEYIKNLFVQKASSIDWLPQDNQPEEETPEGQTNLEEESRKNSLESWKYKRLLSDSGLYYVSNDIRKKYLADSYGVILFDQALALIFEFQEGVAVACLSPDSIPETAVNSFRDFEFYGALNEKGEIVIPFHYRQMYSFCEGYAAVQVETDPGIYCYGYIDVHNRFLVEPVYEYADSFRDGFGWVKQDGKWGIINNQAELVQKPFWFEVEPICQNGSFCFYKANRYGGWGVLDSAGNILVKCQWDNVSTRTISKNVILVKKDGLWGVVDIAGNILIPPRWKRAFPRYSGHPHKSNVIVGLSNNGWEEFNDGEKR